MSTKYAKNIQKFDKLLKNTNTELNIFYEISEIMSNLIKREIDAAQNELLERISQELTFKTNAQIEKFLIGYFDFYDALIEEIGRLDTLEDEDLFDAEIQKFMKNLFATIEKEKLQDTLFDFVDRVLATVIDEYSIDIEDYDSIESLTEIFGDENIAALFIGVNIVASYLDEHENIEYNEIVDIGVSTMLFCMAMNTFNQENHTSPQNTQITSNKALNNINYNVGRNDPCPCGSGKKYKKCCINKDKPLSINALDYEEPIQPLPKMSKNEIHLFYTIWSRFLNYVSKVFADATEGKYIKIYDKNSSGEYIFTKDAVSGPNHYLTIRDFLKEYFFMLLEHFIEDNRVSEKNKDILYEIRDTYKFGNFYFHEIFHNGNAIFYNLENSTCFYSYRTYHDYSKVFPKGEIFEGMFFSYKGYIISDGVAVKKNDAMDENIKKTVFAEYKKARENLSFSLAINKEPQQYVFQLKISIKGSKPPIWRRVLVRPHTSFYGLHAIIQNIFEWEDYHMYMFYGKNYHYTDTLMLEESLYHNIMEVSASEYTISSELKDVKDNISYLYDFGDSWEHTIVLEKILPADVNQMYPLCTGGKRRGPLEDSGGIWNYNEIADAMENPTAHNQDILTDEDGEEYYEDINPKEFDKEQINIRLREEY